MAHEILSVKLWELNEQLSRLSSRIQLSETASTPQLRREINALRRAEDEEALTLRTRLQHSRSEMVHILAEAYAAVESQVRAAQTELQAQAARCDDPEAQSEEQILLAEYALDFAVQAANRALLLALEAIAAQRTGQEGKAISQ